MKIESTAKKSDITDQSYIFPSPEGKERLLRFARLRTGRRASAFPVSYRLGTCDIFPLWFLTAAVSSMKESGNYGIVEEISLYDVFSSFCRLSGDFSKLVTAYEATGRLSCEDAVTAGLFLYTCREYMELCRYLGLKKEEAAVEIRMKWLSGLGRELSKQFGSMDQLLRLNEFLNRRIHRKSKDQDNFNCEMDQFLLSGIFEIMNGYNRKNAQNFWLMTSSSWSREATTEMMFGIKPGFPGLCVNPCIPVCFGVVEVNRFFRNAYYNIFIKNPRQDTSGIRRLVVDGAEYLGNLIPDFGDGKTHRVEVTMGSFD